MKPRISIIVPCYKRKNGTLSIIKDILNQNINNWEAFLLGDCCEDFQSLIDSGEMENFKKEAESKNNRIVYLNFSNHAGGWGYRALNYGIENASGFYTIWAANDDKINKNHFENYLRYIEDEKEDFGLVALRTKIIETNGNFYMRYPMYQFSKIGHSEIIVKSCYLKKTPPHTPIYGHDWNTIDHLINIQKVNNKIINNNEPTYNVYMR